MASFTLYVYCIFMKKILKLYEVGANRDLSNETYKFARKPLRLTEEHLLYRINCALPLSRNSTKSCKTCRDVKWYMRCWRFRQKFVSSLSFNGNEYYVKISQGNCLIYYIFEFGPRTCQTNELFNSEIWRKRRKLRLIAGRLCGNCFISVCYLWLIMLSSELSECCSRCNHQNKCRN